jgi:glutamate decarboxylase
VFKDRKAFNEELVFYVNYLGGEAPTATLNFSKGSSTVLMQYYMFLRLGREGYRRVMKYALDHAVYLRDRLIKSGKFQIMNRRDHMAIKGSNARWRRVAGCKRNQDETRALNHT